MARPANSDAENEVMRKRLAKGALELFRESGQQDISLRTLAVSMGVSHTLLYRYFDNKESLFDAVRCESLLILFDLLRNADRPEQAPLRRLRSVAGALIAYGRKYPKEYRFVFSHEASKLSGESELLALRHNVFNHIVEIAIEAKRQKFILMDPRKWTHMAWATLHGMLSLNESDQLVEGCTFDELVESTLDFLLGAVDGPLSEQTHIA